MNNKTITSQSSKFFLTFAARMEKQERILEVCAGSIDSAMAAANGGAARIELCSGLADGGVTPSAGLIKAVRAINSIKVNVLIREREGDFLYTSDEIDAMAYDVETCNSLGVDGVVVGALTADGRVDVDACRKMLAGKGSMSVTFHRAFDLCRDPFEALDALIELGVDRVLTSGLAASAPEGVEMLRQLNSYAAGRIIILAGGGVKSSNVRDLVDQTGVTEVHASARSAVGSKMEFRRGGVSMGTPGTDEYSRKVTDPVEVAAIVKAIS